MNIGIDVGQVEGALAQGIGWMTMEEIAYNDDGRLLSNALSTYKVPDIFCEVIIALSSGHLRSEEVREEREVGLLF